MVQEAATAGQVRIANELSEGGGLLRADARILRQLLLTLLSNAIRFTPRVAPCRCGPGQPPRMVSACP